MAHVNNEILFSQKRRMRLSSLGVCASLSVFPLSLLSLSASPFPLPLHKYFDLTLKKKENETWPTWENEWTRDHYVKRNKPDKKKRQMSYFLS